MKIIKIQKLHFSFVVGNRKECVRKQRQRKKDKGRVAERKRYVIISLLRAFSKKFPINVGNELNFFILRVFT